MIQSVSINMAKAYALFSDDATTWASAKEVATRTGILPRTSRSVCELLREHGVLESVHAHPGWRYRLSASMPPDFALRARLDKAREVFGV